MDQLKLPAKAAHLLYIHVKHAEDPSALDFPRLLKILRGSWCCAATHIHVVSSSMHPVKTTLITDNPMSQPSNWMGVSFFLNKGGSYYP